MTMTETERTTEPMLHGVDGVKVKLERAYYHLHELDRDIVYFLHLQLYDIVSEIHADKRELAAYFRLRQNPLPAWAGGVGDVVHNLRSALEHLAYQIVDATSGTVGRDIKFPIYTSESNYRRWRTPVPERNRRDPFTGVDPRAIDAIEAEQPYRGQDRHNHPLAILNRLWNHDKHRVLIPAIFHLTPPFRRGPILITPPVALGPIDFKPDPVNDPNRIFGDMFDIRGRLNDGDRVGGFVGEITGPNPHIDVQGGFAFHVCFDDGRPLTKTLLNILDYVNGVVRRLSVYL